MLQEPVTSYFYLRTVDRHPIGVVAMRRDQLDFVTVAASLCSKADSWCRATGVNKALGKLKSTRTSIFWGDELLNSSACQVIEDVLGLPLLRRGVDVAMADKIFHRQMKFIIEHKGKESQHFAVSQ